MLVIMCGLPSSGKSLVADMLYVDDADSLLLRPSDWVPENLQTLGEEQERSWRIEAWKMAMEKAMEHVEDDDPANAIVLDCANAKYNTLLSLIGAAKRYHHQIALLYIHAKSSLCEERAGDQWIGDEVVSKYIKNIKESLPKYKGACDLFLVVDNNSTIEQLREKVEPLRRRLCPNT